MTDLRAVVPAVADYSLGGLSRALARLGIRLVRGRQRLASPDPAYAAKMAAVLAALATARAQPATHAVWYADEHTLYRQPTILRSWTAPGDEPQAQRSWRANTKRRYLGALDATSGRVVWLEASSIRAPLAARFVTQLRAADPERHLTLVWDNWPVHAHASVRAAAGEAGIDLLFLPSYAPWTNPIEQLWRKLNADVVHGHRLADDWPGLRARVAAFFDQFAAGSDALLRYAGLSPD